MNPRADIDSFEPEVRSAFLRHLAELDRLVPAGPPAVSWSDRRGVRGRVAPRSASWTRARPRRATAPRLAAALACVGLVLVLALVASAALRTAPSPVAASPSASPSAVSPSPTALAPTAPESRALQQRVVASFGEDELTALVLGPDGAAYAIDDSLQAVYRIDLASGKRISVAVKGQPSVLGLAVMGAPRLLATGGPDVLILDDTNRLWRWRPATGAAPGQGTLLPVLVEDAAKWGEVRAIGTLLTNPHLGQYSLFVVDSSAGVIARYHAAADGTGYYAEARTNYPIAAGSVDAMYVDGSIYLAHAGVIERYDAGSLVRGWAAQVPAAKEAPYYARLAAADAGKDRGNLYAYDSAGRLIFAFDKMDGTFIGQFALPLSTRSFSGLLGMFVRPGANGADPTLFWIEGGRLWSAVLPGVASFVPPTPPASLPEGACRVGASACG